MSRSLGLVALAVLALAPHALGEVVRGRMVTTDDFIFLGKFCFDHTRTRAALMS